MKPVALQLYTLREAARHDFPAVLKRVAQIGYKGIEISGLHGLKPQEVAGIINDLGLTVASSHTVIPTKDTLQEILDTELTLGNKKVISGFGPQQFETMDGCKEAIDEFNEAVELLKPYGMSFGMHNHWWEFTRMDGKLIYDLLLERCPGMFGQLDIYWAAYAGVDPVEIVSTYKSRLPSLHIKDGPLTKDAPHTAVGDGVLDIPAIINAADENVLEWLLVELDEYDGDMWDAVIKSYHYLISHQLATGNK